MAILRNPRWPPYKEKNDSKFLAFMKGAYVFNFGSIGQKKAEIWQFQNLSEDTSPDVLGRIIQDYGLFIGQTHQSTHVS